MVFVCLTTILPGVRCSPDQYETSVSLTHGSVPIRNLVRPRSPHTHLIASSFNLLSLSTALFPNPRHSSSTTSDSGKKEWCLLMQATMKIAPLKETSRGRLIGRNELDLSRHRRGNHETVCSLLPAFRLPRHGQSKWTPFSILSRVLILCSPWRTQEAYVASYS